jgi:hypothetical protein
VISPFYSNIKRRALKSLPDDLKDVTKNDLWFALFNARSDMAVTLTGASTLHVQKITQTIFRKADFKWAMYEMRNGGRHDDDQL